MVWAYITAYAVIAILLSVGASVAVFMMAFNRRLSTDVLLFYFVALVGCIGYLVIGRDLSLAANMSLVDAASDTTAGRIGNLVSVGLCLVALLQIGMGGAVSRTSVILMAATFQYYFVCFLLPVTFDRWFIFDHKMLYPLASLVVLAMPSRLTAHELGVHFARAASILAIFSLLMIVLDHKAAVLDSYESILPFFKGRLFGATIHPNILGTSCAFACLLVTTFPPRRRIEFFVLLAVNLTALLLCQSKTSWLTLVISQAIVHLPRLRPRNMRIPTAVYLLLFVVGAAAPVALSLFDRSTYNYWSGNYNVSSLTTLTGRTDIWQATFFLLKSHSLITGPGYATYIIYMDSMFPSLIANPHNLYLETLVQAGIIGMVSLIIYLGSLVGTAFSLSGVYRRFGVAYFAFIIVRGMSESFTFQNAFTAPTFWAFLMFMRLLSVMAAEQRAKSTATAPAHRQLAAA